MWANGTAGSSCVVENTAYIAYGANGQEFIDIVSRGNCQLGLYCDSSALQCMNAKALDASCEADKECASMNCLSTGVCGKSSSLPNHFGIWIYIVVAVCIFGGMIGTLVTLFLFHRRHRDSEREKRAQYWREQNAFHENIRQMRETARASILSLPTQDGNASPRSTIYGDQEQNAPILQHAAKQSSGLRHHLSEDGSTEFDEGLLMQRHDNRF